MNHVARRKLRPSLFAAALGLAFALPAAAAPFAYRGSLSDRGEPAEGTYGFRLSFYDAQFGGEALAPATTLDGVAVRNGAFSASVDLEPELQARDKLWLQVEVRDGTGAFVPLAERETLQPKALAAGVCWDVDGNAGTLPITNILGTTDGAALRIQAGAGVGVNTIAPQASLHVRSGGTSLGNATPDPGTIINAEKATGNAFISIMGSAQRGLIFGEPNSTADGGIFYDNVNNSALDFRTGGNVARMQLGVSDEDGVNGGKGAETTLQLVGKNGQASYISAFDIGGIPFLDIGVNTVAYRIRVSAVDTTIAVPLIALSSASKPGGGSWSDSSDLRLKKNIVPLQGALDRLLELRGVNFEYANPDDAMHPAGVRTGFVAQEVQQVFPNWVKPGVDGYLTVGSQGFEALAVEALRTLKRSQEEAVQALRADLERIDAGREQRLATLERENARLRERLDALEPPAVSGR